MQLFDDLPFLWLNFIFAKLHFTHAGDVVDSVPIFICKDKHVVRRIPVSPYIPRHDPFIKFKFLKCLEPLGKDDGRVFNCKRELSNLRQELHQEFIDMSHQ